ncbi:MAG TPA: hypothetical protein VFA38_01380, partial [Nitrospirales bacterium]|nr:hypothetical protein [Nitrospirales bacterium]
MNVSTLFKAIRNPLAALIVLRMLLTGQYYRFLFRLRRQRVLIGKNFRVRGPFDVQGPGLVIFGDDCTVIGSRLCPVTPFTHSASAVLVFGNRVVLNGTRFGCQQRIDVGEGSLLADARIMDTDFHDLAPQNRPRWSTTGTA